MAKLNSNVLDDLTIRAAKPSDKVYSLRDGNGLFLLVHPNGSKYFQLRATLHGKPKLLQLGNYPDLSLKDARILATEKRQLITEHKDPVVEARLVKHQEAKNADATFRSVAETWLAIKKDKLAKSTYVKIEQSFNANVYGRLGAYPIAKIDNHMVRECLLIMQKRGALEFMEKTRGWIKQVFDFALSDHMISDNPIPLTDLRLKRHESLRFPRLKTIADAGKLLRNLNDYAGTFEVSACVYLMLNFAQTEVAQFD